jgi:ribonuclease G
MRRELLIAAAPGEWRAALVEAGVAVELYVVRRAGEELGSFYLGRVRQVLPGLAAALVDIGGERPAFLPFAETAGAAVHEGARVVVQIRREAQGGKPARVTMRPRSSTAEAQARWEAVRESAAAHEPPARLGTWPSRAATLAAATATAPPDRVLTDERGALPELRTVFLDAEYLTEAEWPVDLDAEFDLALAPDVALPGGGIVHFEPTRAGIMVDVDTAGANATAPEQGALSVNLAAAAAIARHIRLRNLGGGIVIDFVGLDRRDHRERVRQALAAALAADPAAPEILGWTRLGHLELVRRRRARPLAEIMLLPGGTAKTPATLAFEALRALARAARQAPGREARLVAAPAVAAALAGEAAEGVTALEARLGRPVAIIADPGCERFQIEPA